MDTDLKGVYTTYMVTSVRDGLVEVNQIEMVKFTPHHICFYDGNGIMAWAVRATDVLSMEQQLAT